MDMQCVVVVRAACARDAEARARLVRSSLVGADRLASAFLLFFFQETTLQAVVLAGAVLFIFCGASPAACVALAPAAAAAVAAAVQVHHTRTADRLVQEMGSELVGFVAEARAGASPPGAGGVAVVSEREAAAAGGDESRRAQVVGTVSVSRARGGGWGGWVRGASVAAGWRRRGVGRALVGAARGGAARAGLAELHALTSQLQPEARALLHVLGWECRGTFERPVCGGASSLLVAHLATALPHA